MGYTKRIQSLRKILTRFSCKAAIISNKNHIRYLCGFEADGAFFIVTDKKTHLLISPLYKTQIERLMPEMHIHFPTKGLCEAVKKYRILPISKCAGIGIEYSEMSVALYQMLCKKFPAFTFKNIGGDLAFLRAQKELHEVRCIAKAASIADKVYSCILKEIRPGVSEKYVAARISFLLRQLGSEGDSFSPIVASGPHTAFPHAALTSRKLAKGDLVLFDFGAIYKGYHSDMTRTVSMGAPTQLQKKIYTIVSNAQEKGVRLLSAGKLCNTIDKSCRSYIEKNGYGKNFFHSTGHGVGLDVHEYPRVSSESKARLKERYVVTIEPGIYIKGWGGVRIEDLYVINSSSAQRLTRSNKKFISL